MLSDMLCQRKNTAYISCDNQSNLQHTEQQEICELCKKYEKNGFTVQVYVPKLNPTQKEKRNTEMKERVLQVVQKSVS